MYEETFITVRYDLLQTSKIEIHHQTENPYVCDSMLAMGCVPYVKQPELRALFGLTPLNLWSSKETAAFDRKSKAALLSAYEAGDHVFWILFGDHGGYTIRMFDTCVKPPRFSNARIAGFIVVRREVWNRARKHWPRYSHAPCAKYVVANFLKECAETIEAQLNRSLISWRYVSWTEDYWTVDFTSPAAALADALSRHPECRYKEGRPDIHSRREVLNARFRASFDRRCRIAARKGRTCLERLKVLLNLAVVRTV